MPFLQSISQDFLAKSLGRKRGTILGGEASVDANYLYIDVKNTGSNTLQVYGNTPIPADYVIVGGGGGGAHGSWYDIGQCWYDTFVYNCCRQCDQCGSGTEWVFSGYWSGNYLYALALDGWGCGKSYLNVAADGAAGGGGFALTGAVNLTSQNYSITVGAGGAGGITNKSTNTWTTTSTATDGGDTTAFGVTAYGGGLGNGGGVNTNPSSGGPCRGASTGATGNGGGSTGGSFNDIGNFGYSDSLWANIGNNQTFYTLNSYWGAIRSDRFSRTLCYPGWGGGVAAPGPGNASPLLAGRIYNLGGGPESRAHVNLSLSSWANDPLSDRKFSPMHDPVVGVNGYTFVEAVGATGQTERMSVWGNVRFGTGITALGLKVGGGGMAGINARSLTDSYGGGYPVAGTTAQGTYSKNGIVNTGGGGGGGITGGSGGNGGSGIVRIRIKRSDIGI